MAQHGPSTITFKGKPHKLEPGDVVTGRKQLAEDTGLPLSTVEDSLRWLESRQQIRQQKSNKGRIISITNWDEFQSPDSQPTTNRQQTDSQPTTNRQQTDSQPTLNKNERMKECKNERKKNTPLPPKAHKSYGENSFVQLTDEEYQKLESKFGKLELKTAIAVLDGWISSKPNQLEWFKKKYSSAFHVLNPISSWVWQRVEALKKNSQMQNGIQSMTSAQFALALARQFEAEEAAEEARKENEKK